MLNPAGGIPCRMRNTCLRNGETGTYTVFATHSLGACQAFLRCKNLSNCKRQNAVLGKTFYAKRKRGAAGPVKQGCVGRLVMLRKWQ